MPPFRKRRPDPGHAAPGPVAALTAELAETRTAITDLLAAIDRLREENRDLRSALTGHRAALDRDRADLKSALARLAAAEPAPPAPPAPDGTGDAAPPKPGRARRQDGGGTA